MLEVGLFTLTPQSLILYMAATLFVVGLVTFIIGVLTLTLRSNSSDVKALAAQTTRLAQKGMAEGVVGIVGHASDLLEALNQLVRTTRGTGIFLAISGLCMMGIAGWLAVMVFSSNP